MSGTQKMFLILFRTGAIIGDPIMGPGSETFCVSATNVFQFAQPKKHHGQQCVRNNVTSFTRTFRDTTFEEGDAINY